MKSPIVQNGSKVDMDVGYGPTELVRKSSGQLVESPSGKQQVIMDVEKVVGNDIVKTKEEEEEEEISPRRARSVRNAAAVASATNSLIYSEESKSSRDGAMKRASKKGASKKKSVQEAEEKKEEREFKGEKLKDSKEDFSVVKKEEKYSCFHSARKKTSSGNRTKKKKVEQPDEFAEHKEEDSGGHRRSGRARKQTYSYEDEQFLEAAIQKIEQRDRYDSTHPKVKTQLAKEDFKQHSTTKEEPELGPFLTKTGLPCERAMPGQIKASFCICKVNGFKKRVQKAAKDGLCPIHQGADFPKVKEELGPKVTTKRIQQSAPKKPKDQNVASKKRKPGPEAQLLSEPTVSEEQSAEVCKTKRKRTSRAGSPTEVEGVKAKEETELDREGSKPPTEKETPVQEEKPFERVKYEAIQDPNPYYIEEEAHLYHNPPIPSEYTEGVDPVDLQPIPHSQELPELPNTGKCHWSFDETQQILLADFSPNQDSKHIMDPIDEKFFLEMLERNDITVISEGLLSTQDLDSKMWGLDYLNDVLGQEYYHKFRRFDTTKDKGGFEKCREVDKLYSMRVGDYIQYLIKRQKVLEENWVDTSFAFTDHEGSLLTIQNVGVSAIYLIDLDIIKLLPCLYSNFLESFRYPGVLPGGALCMMNSVTSNARPFMGPNLYVTPPAAFTHFHQDGHGTVDSGHLCLNGYNEVVMLRRLTERHKKHALLVLTGNHEELREAAKRQKEKEEEEEERAKTEGGSMATDEVNDAVEQVDAVGKGAQAAKEEQSERNGVAKNAEKQADGKERRFELAVALQRKTKKQKSGTFKMEPSFFNGLYEEPHGDNLVRK